LDEDAMSKKVMILLSLVKESTEVPNEEIEKEISKELQQLPLAIPWADKVLFVRVTEELKPT